VASAGVLGRSNGRRDKLPVVRRVAAKPFTSWNPANGSLGWTSRRAAEGAATARSSMTATCGIGSRNPE